MFAPADEKLIKRALDNNQQAWLQLVKRYEGLVYNYGLRMLGQRDDAEDLLQEVFLSVFRNLASWRGEASFKTWLLTITHHRCIEVYRRRREHIDIDGVDSPVSDIDWHHPEQVYQGQQRGLQLLVALHKLPLEQRQVVELKFFQHLPLAAIAAQLNVPLSTIKSRLYSAVDKLQQELETA